MTPGPEGRITAEDVKRAAAQVPAAAPEPSRDPRGAMRRAIAANAARSKREIPHYFLWHTVDVTDALAWLRAHNERRSAAERVLFAALLARAVARAAADAPELNGTFVEGALRSSPAVHLGFATAQRGGGLIAPAILDSLAAVAPEARGRPLAGDADLREELDLDSMDFLRVLVGIKERTDLEVPEKDAPQVFTLDGAVRFLAKLAK